MSNIVSGIVIKVKYMCEIVKIFVVKTVGIWTGVGCCIFRPAFGCCALQTVVEFFFSMFFMQKSCENDKFPQD